MVRNNILFSVKSQQGARYLELRVGRNGFTISTNTGYSIREERSEALRHLIRVLKTGQVGKNYRISNSSGLSNEEFDHILRALSYGAKR